MRPGCVLVLEEPYWPVRNFAPSPRVSSCHPPVPCDPCHSHCPCNHRAWPAPLSATWPLQNSGPLASAGFHPDGHFKFPHLWPVKFPQAESHFFLDDLAGGSQRDGAGGLQAHRGPGEAVPPPRSRQQAAGRMPFRSGGVGEFEMATSGGIWVAIRALWHPTDQSDKSWHSQQQFQA